MKFFFNNDNNNYNFEVHKECNEFYIYKPFLKNMFNTNKEFHFFNKLGEKHILNIDSKPIEIKHNNHFFNFVFSIVYQNNMLVMVIRGNIIKQPITFSVAYSAVKEALIQTEILFEEVLKIAEISNVYSNIEQVISEN